MGQMQMWGRGFAAGPSEIMQAINNSLPVDRRLWREDLAGSKAHAAMLRDQGIIDADDADAILAGLDTIEGEFERDGVPDRPDLEDIHMLVEARLAELIGPAAGRLPGARARGAAATSPLVSCAHGLAKGAGGAARLAGRGIRSVGRQAEVATEERVFNSRPDRAGSGRRRD